MPPRSPDYHNNNSIESSPKPLQGELALVHDTIEVSDLSPRYYHAYKRAQEGFFGRIDMSKFTNHKDLEFDIAKVNKKLAMIRQICLHGTEDEKMAYVQSDVFEYMLHEYIKDAGWFGNDVKSVLPSIYDDLFNGTDLILEQHVGQGAYAFSALGIDVTFSAEGAIKKMEMNKDLLSRGKLGKIKYFKSEATHFIGSIGNIPHFIIGLGRPALFKMTGDYVQNDIKADVNQIPRRMVIEQIVSQAQYYSEFLKSKGFMMEADRYMQVGENMSHLLEETPRLTNEKGVDEVHRAILQYCNPEK